MEDSDWNVHWSCGVSNESEGCYYASREHDWSEAHRHTFIECHTALTNHERRHYHVDHTSEEGKLEHANIAVRCHVFDQTDQNCVAHLENIYQQEDLHER